MYRFSLVAVVTCVLAVFGFNLVSSDEPDGLNQTSKTTQKSGAEQQQTPKGEGAAKQELLAGCAADWVCPVQLMSTNDGFCTWYALKCKDTPPHGTCCWYGSCSHPPASQACTANCLNCISPTDAYSGPHEGEDQRKHHIEEGLGNGGMEDKPHKVKKLTVFHKTQAEWEAGELVKFEVQGVWLVAQIWEIHARYKGNPSEPFYIGNEVDVDPDDVSDTQIVSADKITKVGEHAADIVWPSHTDSDVDATFTVVTYSGSPAFPDPEPDPVPADNDTP